MTENRPEFWQGVPVSTKTTSTTSSQTLFELTVGGPPPGADFAHEIAALEAHGAMSERSDREDVSVMGREARALLAAHRDAKARGDTEAAFAAAYVLGRHMQHWRDKDHAEGLFTRGGRDLAQRQELARAATRSRAANRGDWRAKARRLDAQLRENDPGTPRKARAAAIAERLRMSARTVYDFLSDTEPGR